MAEPKLCFQIPIELLDIYIEREQELLDGLLFVGDLKEPWQRKLNELVSSHIALLKHYSLSKRSMQNMQNVYFKASSKKDEIGLEFAPVNLHLQRMWVHNDTLNKTGLHDVITAGAFSVHTHNTERSGGLIRLLQLVKDVNSSKAALNWATANKIQVEHDSVLVLKGLISQLIFIMEQTIVSSQAKQTKDVLSFVGDIKVKLEEMLNVWNPSVIEESLSFVGWSKEGNAKSDQAIKRLTSQINMSGVTPEYEFFEPSSSSSSKETSPTSDPPALSSSVPNICQNDCERKQINLVTESAEGTELYFYNDYFKSDREERRSFNHSFRSVDLSANRKLSKAQTSSFEQTNSFHLDFKNSASLEQVSYKCLMDSLSGENATKPPDIKEKPVSESHHVDIVTRRDNLSYLMSVKTDAEGSVLSFADAIMKLGRNDNESETQHDADLESIRSLMDDVKTNMDVFLRMLRGKHATLRLRCEAPEFAREHSALQIRRDACFSQALTTVTSGLLCWLCSVSADVVTKILSSGLGPLCGFEGLLSLYSTEKAMWGDMVVAIEDLQTVQFTLTKVGHSNTAIPKVTGTRGSLMVNIPISDSLYAKFASKEYLTFTITAVFFNIGVNAKATLAEALGETMPQHHSNNDNLDRLNKYYNKFSKIFPPDLTARASSRTKPLEEVMENLKTAVQKKLPKNIEVLHLAALATRLMNGVRFTSCKSAKDRTGMSVTLEQCSILTSEYHLAEHESQKALNVMRSEGCRRENTFKNIGVKKYAFTKKQVASLPKEYRPPAGTYGSTQT